MNEKECMTHVGSMEQLAYVRRCVIEEGRANGLQMVLVKNGRMQYQIMLDKCLDIASLEYGGVNLNFTAKPGLMGRNHFDTDGQEAIRSIMGGMFFTCGFENICAPWKREERELPMHGRIRTTPAEQVCTDAYWEDGAYKLMVSGQMRQAELFGENLMLRRQIESTFGCPEIHIRDEIVNQSGREEPLMVMYHCNMGFPLVSEACEIILPSIHVTPREEWSANHVKNWRQMEEPKEGEREYVFLHELAADEKGNTFGAVANRKLGIGVQISFNQRNLPYFMQWKSVACGDYVIGLEPSNSCVYGRKYHEERGDLHKIAPYGKEVIEWSVRILDGLDKIDEARVRSRALKADWKEEKSN